MVDPRATVGSSALVTPTGAVSPVPSWGAQLISESSTSSNWGNVIKIAVPSADAKFTTQTGFVIMCAGCGRNDIGKGYTAAALTLDISRTGSTYTATFTVTVAGGSITASGVNMYFGTSAPSSNAPGSWKPKATLFPTVGSYASGATFTATKTLTVGSGNTLYAALHFVSTKCTHYYV
ncbi:hypothetical protein HYH03_011311 [Edaphochlamys debaryana]|uniref:Uncharacterized protein n=1 Tax=Edaphochlamys debaryana TaxID=47281 RepID=A0A836BVM2_9CHLO|nr:hypothetical protein HYH03_011311 [Edaphochlamys debaryana]|eukprot:KAG2490182.1 hypothetical protein HYH03_011311 [Edaphochlamys debaryana]